MRAARLGLPLLFLIPLICSRSSAEDAPFQYDLRIGRSLRYTSVSESQTPDASSRATTDVLVLSANPDGSRRLVIRETFTVGNAPQDAQVGAIDLFPDGHFRTVGPAQQFVNLNFPPLPKGTETTWQAPPTYLGMVETYSFGQSDGSRIMLKTSSDGPQFRVYGVKDEGRCFIDRRKGVPVAWEGELTQSWGHNKHTEKSKTTLEKDEMMDAARTARLASEYEKLFALQAKRYELGESILNDPANAKKLLAQDDELLAAASKQISEPEVAVELQRMIKQNHESRKDTIEDAKHRLTVLNKPLAWEATDLSGKHWASDQLKGKVVVMEFWYRGCGYCIAAMPQIEQIAKDYRDKSVVVLGMNTDTKEENAKFVVDALKIDYPQLKSEQISKNLGIYEFPTFLIIDRQGIVRCFTDGGSPDVGARLRKRIDALLQ